MDSNAFSMIFVVLLVLALMIFLYLRAERAMHRQSQETAELIAKTTELAISLARDQASAAEDASEKATQLAKEMLEETVTQLEQMRTAQMETLKMAQQSMDASLMRSSTGLQAISEQVAKTLSSTVALLGTSDTVAYQTVMSGVAPTEQSNDPYPVMDEAEMERLEQERRRAAESVGQAMNLLEQLGVPRAQAE